MEPVPIHHAFPVQHRAHTVTTCVIIHGKRVICKKLCVDAKEGIVACAVTLVFVIIATERLVVDVASHGI